MKAAVLYRIASVLLVLFAAGHTVGFLRFNPPSAEGQAVYESMNQVHFQVKGSSFSYGGFYRGFGLFVTVYLLFSAFLAWYLGFLAGQQSPGERYPGLGPVRGSGGLAGSELDLFFVGAGNVIHARGRVSGLGRVAGKRHLDTDTVRSSIQQSKGEQYEVT
jgi:hypothetical protein